MLKIRYILLIALVGIPCLAGTPPQGSAAWGEVLYWKPTAAGTAYAGQQPGPRVRIGPISPEFRERRICPGYEAGFRIGASGAFVGCDIYVQLSGSYVHFRGSSTASGFVYPLLPIASSGSNEEVDGRARADQRICYWDIDFRAIRRLVCNDRSQLHIFGGVRYVDVDDCVVVRTDGSFINLGPAIASLRQRRRVDFSGAGPELGLGARCKLFCGVDAGAELATLFLFGARREDTRAIRTDIQNNLGSQNQAFRPDHCDGLFPGFISHLSVGYTACLFCGDLRLAVGYDLLYYWGVSSKAVDGSTPFPNGNGNNVALPFGLAGPSISVGLTF